MSDIRLFLCGDVMTGRGIDQILPHPGDPLLYEPAMTSALGYLRLAERASGPIPRPADFGYVWGDLPRALEALRPAARIVNLETAITDRGEPDPKGINYRMHPANVLCLTAAGIDCCVLANNHVLDWGVEGLEDTLDTLSAARLPTAGAGRTAAEAAAPAVLEVDGSRRILVFGLCTGSSGVPRGWAATGDRPGVSLVEQCSDRSVARVAEAVRRLKQPGDIVVASVHWGGNWGYAVPRAQQHFAHALIDRAGVAIVHGHSSHHPKAIELYRGRLILYGCGDLLNDYEGIGGYEEYRGDLTLAYFPLLSAEDNSLLRLDLRAYRIRQFRLSEATHEETAWLAERLTREGQRFGTRLTEAGAGALTLDRPLPERL